MKVLLRDEETRLYYSGEKGWVPELSGAINFRELEVAARESLQWQERSLSVVLKYENPEGELALNPVFCIPTPRGREALMTL